ncbi:MAG: trypsin-like peptidase domain-containing protein, partial [Planctomycetota bacterium]
WWKGLILLFVGAAAVVFGARMFLHAGRGRRDELAGLPPEQIGKSPESLGRWPVFLGVGILIFAIVIGGGMATAILVFRKTTPLPVPAAAAAPAAPAVAPGPNDAAPPINVADPTVAANFVFFPTFHLKTRDIGAGSAFAVKLDDIENPVILSALHLLGPSGGLPVDVPGTKVPAEVKALTLVEMFDNDKDLTLKQPGIALPNTAPLGRDSQVGDVMAFWATKDALLSPARLAAETPKRNDLVWLAYSAENDPNQRTYRAKVSDVNAKSITYTFDSALRLPGTSGAPLLNAAGEVVGIHLGGRTTGNVTTGIANPVSAFRTALIDAAKRAPISAPLPEPAKKPRGFASNLGRYTVKLPGAASVPKENIKNPVSKDLSATAFIMNAELPDATLLQVTVFRFLPNKKLNATNKERIDDTIRRLAADLKGTVTETSDVVMDQMPGKSVVIAADDLLARARVFAQQNNVYQIVAVSPKTTTYGPDIEQFLLSLRIPAK